MSGKLPAQVYSPSADYSFSAAYNPPGGTDKVFIVNKPTYKAEVTASIIAVSVDSLPGWSFQWAVFNPSTGVYTNVPGVGNGASSEIDTITVSSGYKVVMTKGSIDSTFRIWLLFNDLDLHITNKDENNKLLFGYYNCSSLDIKSDTTQINLFYYNPLTKNKIIIPGNFAFRWKVDNEDAALPSGRMNARVTDPPSEDTWYTLTLSDIYGLKRSDSVFYESIQSKAVISEEFIDLGDSLEYLGKDYENYYDTDQSTAKHSAPAKFRFDVSGSHNLVSYKIDFGDEATYVSAGDTLNIVHEYKKPGVYKVILTTKSDKPYECVDLDSINIEIEYANIENFIVPNVFTPNNDGRNDYFRCVDVSVIHIDIAIFNRAGMKMHSYTGNIRDWTGWDGKIRNSERDAPEGVYFYVISTFSAYEDITNPINSKVMKGYFHLYR